MIQACGMTLRKYSFRGQNKDSKWFYGYPYGDSRIVNVDDDISYLVKPKSICESTGRTDKNGIEIFEGDILNVYDRRDENYCQKCMVYYNHLSCSYELIEPTFDSYMFCTDLSVCTKDEVEVIGNFIDNPEYLLNFNEQ